ncbi:MAG TPA: hypothetical protein VFX68_07590 [Sulfuricurvum sp.]|nr:hypothetical protein [Sulfuricurvum sp.]
MNSMHIIPKISCSKLMILPPESPRSGVKKDSYEVCEFYVVPYFRKNAIGMRFAHAIFESYPGDWEIKQIQEAEYTTKFWRKTIERFNETTYTEECYDDPYWGIVTRQKFTVN